MSTFLTTVCLPEGGSEKGTCLDRHPWQEELENDSTSRSPLSLTPIRRTSDIHYDDGRGWWCPQCWSEKGCGHSVGGTLWGILGDILLGILGVQSWSRAGGQRGDQARQEFRVDMRHLDAHASGTLPRCLVGTSHALGDAGPAGVLWWVGGFYFRTGGWRGAPHYPLAVTPR